MTDQIQSQPDIRQFQTSDGYRHHYRHWVPQGRPRGFVVALHGIQSHSGWYEASSRALCEAGYEVFFLDRRGSGLNPQDRGHARHQERLINDVTSFLGMVRTRRNELVPTSPVVLLGLSWGGKLAAVVASRRQELMDGLILLYPGIHSYFHTSWWNQFRLGLARRLELTEKRVPIPLDDPRLFTSNPEWQTFIRNDELAIRRVSVAFLLSNLALDRAVNSAAGNIRCPSALMLAGRDRIVNNPHVKDWFGRLAGQDRSVFEYPSAFHTLEFEACRDQYLADLIGWLEHVQKTA